MVIKEIEVKDILTKTNLPVSDYAVNPYVGCTHACKYCYASFMKRFTNHPEPWGEFVDVKTWPEIHHRDQHQHLHKVRPDPARLGSHQAVSQRPCVLVDQYPGRGLPERDGPGCEY